MVWLEAALDRRTCFASYGLFRRLVVRYGQSPRLDLAFFQPADLQLDIDLLLVRNPTIEFRPVTGN